MPDDHRRLAARRREAQARRREAEAQKALMGVLAGADAEMLSRMLSADPGVATAPLAGVPPLLVLLRCRARRTREAVRTCARLLLDAGADPDSHTTSSYGKRLTALREAVISHDLELARLLIERGATKDTDALYEAALDEEFNAPDDIPFTDLLS